MDEFDGLNERKTLREEKGRLLLRKIIFKRGKKILFNFHLFHSLSKEICFFFFFLMDADKLRMFIIILYNFVWYSWRRALAWFKRNSKETYSRLTEWGKFSLNKLRASDDKLVYQLTTNNLTRYMFLISTDSDVAV